MTSVFSKFAPTTHGRSFYQELRRRGDDVEDQAGLLDEENLSHDFHEYDLEHAEGLGVEESRTISGGAVGPTSRSRSGQDREHRHPRASQEEDEDNDVPASLLVEAHEVDMEPLPGQQKKMAGRQSGAIPGPSHAGAQWETAQNQQRLHDDGAFGPSRPASGGVGGLPSSLFTGMVSGNAKKKAEWRWANVSNLDNFIKDVYDYYLGNGMGCILVERALHLVNVAFIAFYLTFLSQCVNYGKFKGSKSLSEVLVPQCTKHMSAWWNLGLWMFAFYFIWKSIQYLLDLRRLRNIRDFYIHLLDIPDEDMQTITWQEVVARIMALRDHNPKTATTLSAAQRQWLGSQSKERLDASDIANRLMRRENYMIAMFNKDILDLRVPVPFLRNRQLLTRTMEWLLMFNILDFVFDDRGQVNQEFIRSERRAELSTKLRERFRFTGAVVLILSPFLVTYLVVVYFLMYFHEFHKNPSALASRIYTPIAEWKFREFNELPHLFRKRLGMSYPFASHYLDQFPKAKTEMVAWTVAFISGSLASVLALASIIDSESFVHFEITPDRTVLFYGAILTAIWAAARGSTSEEQSVFDPEFAMRNVIQYTHHEPDHWKDRLHSSDVKTEFSALYQPKAVVFVEEILSIIAIPFILWGNLSHSSDHIIDFFREFTIHVDGLGYVCTFAEFDFKKGIGKGNEGGGAGDIRDDYYSTKHGKMEASYYGFMGNYANFALNPRTGTASTMPPGARNQFRPPPAWPSLNSPPPPMMDLQASNLGRERGMRGMSTKDSRSGPAISQSSPMASILLDPHHHPPNTSHTNRSIHTPRRPRSSRQGVIEEALENSDEASNVGGWRPGDEEAYESGGALEESAWQTSPARTLSRENSAADARRPPDAGVVHMIRQFNQAQLNRRPGGVR
ncbi:autophagy protein Apg9-domain-containing protein [Dichotomopilus funicola]|uniref:Autophagy-related protein 9 n=1 Tax=Dichotomopilus funicola TaxID=1934379 RepID=A0AAN6ZIW1_9PEZI|nr:autophagy protein Apg9-domain-containing protein [Dichotomopilus funicola]